MMMDEMQLSKWKQSFEQEINNIQIEYDAFFLKENLEELYSIQLDDTHGWRLQLDEKLPKEINDRLTKAFLYSKPGDSM